MPPCPPKPVWMSVQRHHVILYNIEYTIWVHQENSLSSFSSAGASEEIDTTREAQDIHLSFQEWFHVCSWLSIVEYEPENSRRPRTVRTTRPRELSAQSGWVPAH